MLLVPQLPHLVRSVDSRVKVKSTIDKIAFVKKHFPSWLKGLLAIFLILVIISFASNILSTNINVLANSYPAYESNIELLIKQINKILNVDLIELIKKQSGNLDFGMLLQSVFNSLFGVFSNAFMIILYSVFVLFEEVNFQSKLEILFTDEIRQGQFIRTLEKIEQSITKYLGLKTQVSLVTGVLSYIALYFIGIDSPVFWAFLIFLLNYIPTIGSLVGTLFPAIFCLLQFGEFMPSILVLLIVGVIQLIVGNILEPRLMGSSMNISALVTILALTFWGAIWGITGMILSVPIMVILLIIFSQFDSTRPIAIMLSEKGEVEI